MKMDSRRTPQVVEEVNWGLYVWRMPNGQWVGDEDNNFLNIKSEKGDVRKIAELTDAVHSYGIEDGAPYFLAGHRQIDDEEYDIQRQRMMFGLVPDEQDIGILIDESEYGR